MRVQELSERRCCGVLLLRVAFVLHRLPALLSKRPWFRLLRHGRNDIITRETVALSDVLDHKRYELPVLVFHFIHSHVDWSDVSHAHPASGTVESLHDMCDSATSSTAFRIRKRFTRAHCSSGSACVSMKMREPEET